MCAAVAAAGFTALGFNFGYSEAGRRSPDPMPRLLAAYTDVVEYLRREQPGRPVVIGGRSMGGRAASLLLAQGLACDGLMLLNYPLLPINRKADSRPRVDHWPDLTGPVLFVHGTRDRLFDEGVFAESRVRLSRATVTVHVVDDADHSFAVRKSTGRTPADVDAEIGAAVGDWLVRSPGAVQR